MYGRGRSAFSGNAQDLFGIVRGQTCLNVLTCAAYDLTGLFDFQPIVLIDEHICVNLTFRIVIFQPALFTVFFSFHQKAP